MGRGKHTEAQIIEALKQVEAGRTAEEVSRQHGISKHTMYGCEISYNLVDGNWGHIK